MDQMNKMPLNELVQLRNPYDLNEVVRNKNILCLIRNMDK